MLDLIAEVMTSSHYGLSVSRASADRLLVSRRGGRILFACEAGEEGSRSVIVRVGHYRKGHELDLVLTPEPSGSGYLIDGESYPACDLAKIIVERAVLVLNSWPPS